MSSAIGSSKIASSGTPSILSSGSMPSGSMPSGSMPSGSMPSSGVSSAPSSGSSGGHVEFAITNMHVQNTEMGSPSNGDFIIECIGSIGGTITSITGTAIGFVVFPASPLPVHMNVGDSMYVFCSTDPLEILSGTDLRVDYIGDNGETGFLLVTWIA